MSPGAECVPPARARHREEANRSLERLHQGEGNPLNEGEGGVPARWTFGASNLHFRSAYYKWTTFQAAGSAGGTFNRPKPALRGHGAGPEESQFPRNGRRRFRRSCPVPRSA
jgi:hypothetical protein